VQALLERQREQDPAQRRSDDIRQLKDGRSPGNRVHEVLSRDKVRHQRGAGWPAERATRPDDEENRKNRPHAVDAGPREAKKHRGTDRLQRVANQDHMTAVEAVGHVAGGQNEDQPRQKQHQPRVAQIDGPVRDLVDLPRHRQRLRLRAHDDDDACELIAEEVAGEKRGCGLGHASLCYTGPRWPVASTAPETTSSLRQGLAPVSLAGGVFPTRVETRCRESGRGHR
jgi:hypothetical protein